MKIDQGPPYLAKSLSSIDENLTRKNPLSMATRFRAILGFLRSLNLACIVLKPMNQPRSLTIRDCLLGPRNLRFSSFVTLIVGQNGSSTSSCSFSSLSKTQSSYKSSSGGDWPRTTLSLNDAWGSSSPNISTSCCCRFSNPSLNRTLLLLH